MSPSLLVVRSLWVVLAGLGAACGGSTPGDPSDPIPPAPEPAGIYALSQGQPPQLPSAELLAKPFVDGFVVRLFWRDLEPARDVYDFSRIQQVLAALAPSGKKLTLQVFATHPPGYVMDDPAVQKYDVLTAAGGGTSPAPVPWDEIALARYEALYRALAEFRVADAARGGALVPLPEHSALAIVPSWIMGMNGIRDTCQLSGQCPALHTIPGYSRERFSQAILRSLRAVVDRFPRQRHYVPIFRLSDPIASPSLDEFLIAQMKQEFFPTSGAAVLGLFEENLSCAQPGSTAPLFREKANTYIMFQMLQSWITPFANPAATDACLVTATPGNRSTATSGPGTGIRHGFDTFGARYFEVYQADLLHPGFAEELAQWHATLHAARAP